MGNERITWLQNTFRPCTIALEEAHSTHISDAHRLGRTRTATRSTVATRRPTSPRHRSTAPMRANTRSGRAPLGSGLERRAAHPRMRLEEKATNDPNLMSRLKGHRARGLRAAESRKCQKSAVRREQRDGPCLGHARAMAEGWALRRWKTSFGKVWKVPGSAKCAGCAIHSPPDLLFEHRREGQSREALLGASSKSLSFKIGPMWWLICLARPESRAH